MSTALDSLRVIDFGQYLAGPLVGMLLADAGADVVRVDPPGGPRWQHHANAMLQRGKRSIMLDLKAAGDRQLAERLINSADVVVENFRPGVMDRLGLGPSAMLKARPELIYCSIPGFAADDPRASIPAFEGVVAAAAGVYLPGTWDTAPEPAPLFNPLPLASNFAAVRAATAIVAALIARQRGSGGQHIEVPLFDATFELKYTPHRPGDPRGRTTRVQLDLLLDTQFECADGRFVNLSWLEGRQLRAFAQLVGLADELERDGLLDELQLWKPGPIPTELKRRLAPVFRSRTAAEWTYIANPAADLAECLTTQEWLRLDDHARQSGAVVSLVDPEYGATHQAGRVFTMRATPPRADRPRHVLDSDREAILNELPATRSSPALRPSDASLSAALQGMRVVDVTQILAGPTCGRILAEYGAEVVKINAPVGLPVSGHYQVNSGKQTALINLKTQPGIDVLHRLLQQSDVFLMNFSPDAAERLGVSDAQVRQYRPDIVYTSISTYDWNGPRGTHRGHEQMGQAVTGMQERFGRGTPQPVMQSMPICDLGTGNLGALATMLALFHRLRTGEGQFVGASLAQTGTFHQIPFMIDYAGRRWNDDPHGQSARGLGPMYRLYRARDGWFFLAAPGSDAVRQLAAVEGLHGVDECADWLFERELGHRFAKADAPTWVARLTAAGLGAHAVVSAGACMEDPWVQTHGLSIPRQIPELGDVLVTGPSGRFSRTPVQATAVPAAPGGNNREVLRQVGLESEHAAFEAEGVIASSVRSTLARLH